VGGVGGEDEGVEGGLMWVCRGLEFGDAGCEILGDLK